jgi:hypothetical protein
MQPADHRSTGRPCRWPATCCVCGTGEGRGEEGWVVG